MFQSLIATRLIAITTLILHTQIYTNTILRTQFYTTWCRFARVKWCLFWHYSNLSFILFKKKKNKNKKRVCFTWLCLCGPDGTGIDIYSEPYMIFFFFLIKQVTRDSRHFFILKKSYDTSYTSSNYLAKKERKEEQVNDRSLQDFFLKNNLQDLFSHYTFFYRIFLIIYYNLKQRIFRVV